MSPARCASHGLTDGETTILALWDGGLKDVDAIATRTGYGANYVDQVIRRYNVSDRSLGAFDKMSAAGTALLLAAINEFHPETRRMVHP